MAKATGKTTKLTPTQAAQEALDEMARLADPKKAATYQRYFKEPVSWFGLGNTSSKRFIKELVAKAKGASWTLPDVVTFCDQMVRDPHVEPRGIAFQVLAAFVDQAGPGLLTDVRRWLEKSCDNWALVDNLAPSVLAPLLRRHPRLLPKVVAWTGSRNMWLRRASAVVFVPLVRDKKLLDAAYDVATRLFGDEEDLMHKAVGWMLREAGKQDMPRLERFLRAEGPRIPRTTLRYAIERFPKDKRKTLLEATRPPEAG